MDPTRCVNRVGCGRQARAKLMGHYGESDKLLNEVRDDPCELLRLLNHRNMARAFDFNHTAILDQCARPLHLTLIERSCGESRPNATLAMLKEDGASDLTEDLVRIPAGEGLPIEELFEYTAIQS